MLALHGYFKFLLRSQSLFPLQVNWNPGLASFHDIDSADKGVFVRTMTIKDIDVSWRGGIFFRGCDDSNPDALWKVRGGPKQPAIPPTLFFSSFFF
jgi:hypothetical protein